jgi:lysozyme
MTLSDDLIDFIAAWEGYKPMPATDRLVQTVWDIGHGHVLTRADVGHPILGRYFDDNERIIKNGTPAPLTREEAREVLIGDLDGYAECVDEAIGGVALAAHEREAAVALCYNIGCGAFTNSTLARRLREGNPFAAEDEWLRWNRAAGRVVAGLVKRRRAELAMFVDANYNVRP